MNQQKDKNFLENKQILDKTMVFLTKILWDFFSQIMKRREETTKKKFNPVRYSLKRWKRKKISKLFLDEISSLKNKYEKIARFQVLKDENKFFLIRAREQRKKGKNSGNASKL